MNRTRFALALLAALFVGACTRTATEPNARPPAASYEVKTDTTATTQNTAPADTTNRGGGIGSGGH